MQDGQRSGMQGNPAGKRAAGPVGTISQDRAATTCGLGAELVRSARLGPEAEPGRRRRQPRGRTASDPGGRPPCARRPRGVVRTTPVASAGASQSSQTSSWSWLDSGGRSRLLDDRPVFLVCRRGGRTGPPGGARPSASSPRRRPRRRAGRAGGPSRGKALRVRRGSGTGGPRLPRLAHRQQFPASGARRA